MFSLMSNSLQLLQMYPQLLPGRRCSTAELVHVHYIPLRATAISCNKRMLSEVESVSVFALRPGVGKLSGKAKLVNI